MASIKDIAAELGVSTTTVSLVLSGKYHNGRISKGMVERVLESAKRLNYHPNMIAKSLKLGSSKSVGLIVADITNPYFAKLVFVIQTHLQNAGYTLLIMNTNESVEQMGNTITMLQDRRVDGFIIAPTVGGEEHIKTLLGQNMPLVLIDRYYRDVESCNVLSDNYTAIYKSVLRLSAAGHHRICFVSIDNDMIQISERQRGYCEAMAHIELPEHIWLVDYDTPQAQMESAMSEILEMDGGCDAIIFAINRLSAIGAKILVQRGVVIGRDIDVVYFDKNNIFNLLPNHVPNIIQPIEEVGNLASELLLQQINKSHADNSSIDNSNVDNSVEFQPSTHLLPCQLKWEADE
ncbi:MAG: LacI family DNA-binding transcriptional regulator [Rikenellaceae bacterium]